MIVERVEHPDWLSNAYLVAEGPGGHGVFIDSNGLTGALEERGERDRITITHVLCTHGHADHVVAIEELAARHGVTVVNAPGTVDSGYRGEILVNLVNLDPSEPFTVRVGDRIAQLVVQHYLHGVFEVADSLPDSERGETGHGSTGGFGLAQPG